MSNVRLCLALSVLLLQGCATSTPSATGASAPTRSAANKAPPLDPQLAEMAREYDPVYRNGQWKFCKRERPIGSNLYRTVCITETQLRSQAEATRKIADDIKTKGH